MGILNSLIMSINMSLGGKVNLYRGFYILGFLTIFVFNVFYAKKFDIKKGKALLVTVLSYALIFAWAFVLAWVECLFADWGHHNAVRVYIWMPALLFVMSKPVSVDWKKLCDFIAPSACIVYGIARLGCLFPGCCYGIPCQWGLYSKSAGYMVFPVQLCEALTALILAGLAMYMNRKKKLSCARRFLIAMGKNRCSWFLRCLFWMIKAMCSTSLG